MKKLIFIISALFFCVLGYSQGEITGAIEDWSLKRAIMNTNFDTIFTKTDSWVTPEMFGAVGDSITDDATAFSNMITFAKANGIKTIKLSGKSYKIESQLDITGLNIEGNNANIIANEGINLFVSSGDTLGFVSLTRDSRKKESWLTVPTSLLNQFSAGDYVKIISDSIAMPGENENVRIGEIHKVWKVDSDSSRLFFKDYIFSDYYTTYNARASKINMVTSYIRDLNVIYPVSEVNETAFQFKSGTHFIQNVNIYNAYLQGIIISDVYNTRISNVSTFNGVLEGIGYGISIAGASMYTKISNSNFIGHRHCITTGGTDSTGNANRGGISWGSVISNCTGTAGINGVSIFDSHASTGSITYNNCVAYGGIAEDFANVGIWNVATAYTTGDTVNVGNEYFIAAQATTGNNPTTDTTETYWTYKVPNIQSGFHGEGLNFSVKNCEVYNTSNGVVLDALDNRRVDISNLYCENVRIGVASNSDNKIKQLFIKDLQVNNSFNKKLIYGVVLSGDVDELYVDKITTKNARAFFTSSNESLPSTIKLSNISCSRDYSLQNDADIGIVIGVPIARDYIFNNVTVVNMPVFRIPNNALYDTINSISFNNITNTGNLYYPFDFQQPTRHVNITSFINDSTQQSFAYIKLWLDFINIDNSKVECESVFTIQSGGTLNKYSKGNSIFEITNASLYEFNVNNRGTNAAGVHEILSNYQIAGWDSSPSGTIPARLGTLYTNKTGTVRLYLKQTDDGGNTGWTQITIP